MSNYRHLSWQKSEKELYSCEEIGHFSSDKKGCVALDQSYKRYYISPDPEFIGYDLHSGADSYKDDYQPWEHDLQLILRWIIQQCPR